MSQILMTQTERIEAVQGFGYTEREAAFLCTAALHGGYFLRRQYAQYVQRSRGGTTAALVEKALAAGHARACAYAHHTLVYHLCARPFYAVLGQSDNRNRREREPFSIKNKLMSLDFVLDHPHERYLATEDEKVDYFTRVQGLALESLPRKVYRSKSNSETTVRHFVEKYPIFVNEAGPTFCFVDEGLTTASRFDTFLKQYAPFLAAAQRFHILYVAARPLPFRWAQASFQRFIRRLKDSPQPGLEPASTRRHRHFAERQQIESRQLAGFDRAKLIRYREERAEFAGEETDALYERWKRGAGDEVVADFPSSTPMADAPPVGTFSTYLLRQNYEFLGTLTA